MKSLYQLITISIFFLTTLVANSLSLPNLTPYKPSSWSDKIVVSSVTGTRTDSSNLKTSDTLYIDWAVINNGNTGTTSAFYNSLYIDGVYKTFNRVPSPLNPNYYGYMSDYNLGSLNAGTHTLKIVADSSGVITESNGNDNEYTKTITVTQGSVNLTPYKPSSWSDKIVVSRVTGTRTDSSNLKTSDTLYLDWAFRNNGDSATSGTFYVALYLDGAFKIRCEITSPLSAGYYNYCSDWNLGSFSAGTHTLKMVVDYTNAITESNENDNEYTKTITVTQGSANLTPYKPSSWSDKIVVSNVTGTTTDSLNLQTSDTLYIDMASRNNGDSATSGGFKTALYLDGNLEGYCTRSSSLSAGYYSYCSDINLGSLSAGTHTLKIVTDATNTITESNENDNEYTKTITVTQTLVNMKPYKPLGWSDKIVVSKVTGTTTDSSIFKANDTLYIDMAYQNNGDSAASAGFKTALYLDGNFEVSCTRSSSLSAGYYSYCSDYNLGSLSAGTHTLKMVVDYTDVITESNENDNEYTKTITVIQAPANLTPYKPLGWSDKIVVSTVTGTTTDTSIFTVTDTLYIDWAIKNSGAGAVNNSYDVALSVDGQVKKTWTTPSLSGGSLKTIKDYSIGSLSAGSHTLNLVVDSTGVITEDNEADNEYLKTITISSACFQISSNVSPQGTGIITKNLSPNCGGSSSSVNTSSDDDPQPNQSVEGQDKFFESLLGVNKAKAFSSLKALAEKDGVVSVIVGLKIGSQRYPDGLHSNSQGAAGIAARMPIIAQAQTSFLARLSSYNVSSVKRFKTIPFLAMRVDLAALEYLLKDPDVLSIVEDKLNEPFLEESGPLIGAPTAWSQGFSGAGQTIAILDTGVDKNHPFLQGKVVSEACYSTTAQDFTSLCPDFGDSTEPGSAMPCQNGCDHGTHVAGIAAGKGATRSGVAKDANIIAIQVFSKGSDSWCEDNEAQPNCVRAYTSDILLGLERVYELKDVFNVAAANMSLGGGKYFTHCDLTQAFTKAVIDNLRAVGIATVIASGNDKFSNGISSPACISSAVSVGSTIDGSGGTIPDSISDFSNSASILDLLAPGQWITSSVPGGGTATWSGTSMAAPQVAGAWAVLKSKETTGSVDQILSALTSTGKPITDLRNNLTKPRIQIVSALNSLTTADSYSSNTSVTLTATPSPGFQFKSWSGCDSVSGNECTVQTNAAKNVTATFEPVSTGDSDLIVTSFTASTTATVGDKISLASGIKNQGSANSEAFRLGAYLSTNQTITTYDTLFATCNYDTGLQAGKSSSCSGEVSLPSSITTGTYFLGAIVDDQNKISENSETNNTLGASSGSIVINLPPNLTPAQPLGWSDKIVVSTQTETTTDSSLLASSDTLYVDWAVKNTGSVPTSNPFSVTLSVDGIARETWTTSSSLGPNGWYSGKDYSIGSLTVGSHTLKVVVDSTNAITESNETDNTYTKTISITGSGGQPNLTPAQPLGWSDKIVVSTGNSTNTDSSTLSPTDTLYVDWAVKNTGSVTTSNSYSISLSVDGVVKNTWTTSSPLGPNHWYSAQDYSIGSLSVGSHTLEMVVDSTNAMTESNETDNTYTKTITVTETTQPNLTPAQPLGWSDKIVVSTGNSTNTDSSTLSPTDTLYVDWATINNGNKAVGNNFQVTLWVDGLVKKTWTTSSPLGQNESYSAQDYLIGSLSAGSHNIEIVVDSTNDVTESNEADNTYTKSISVTPGASSTTSFVPIVLSVAGLNDSFFTSEMILTNRGTKNAILNYTYQAAFGGGTGTGSDFLAAGKQKIVPDAISYLASLGIPIPGSGNRGGTLEVKSSGASDVAVLVRTTTLVADGRAGLAYAGILNNIGSAETVYLCGLRQNTNDRSNVAVQNNGTAVQGNITLRVTIFSGIQGILTSTNLPDVILPPGGWYQFSGILNYFGGFGTTNGFVKVERVSGTAPFYAYGVINDNFNSDGSFVFPVTESSLVGKTGQTLPVIVETTEFNSELTVTNFSDAAKTINFSFVADAVQTASNTASFDLTLQQGEQKIIPDIVDFLRQAGILGIGARGPTFAGALFASVASSDMTGIVIGGRTGSPGGGGQYGLFYNAVPIGVASTDTAWIYGLQQNAENRSNLALVNTGEVDDSSSIFELDIYDGGAGLLLKTVSIAVPAKGWKQIGAILTQSLGTTQGYVRVRKTTGNNPFITYGVINDGGSPGQRSGDGAYIPSQN